MTTISRLKPCSIKSSNLNTSFLLPGSHFHFHYVLCWVKMKYGFGKLMDWRAGRVCEDQQLMLEVEQDYFFSNSTNLCPFSNDSLPSQSPSISLTTADLSPRSIFLSYLTPWFLSLLCGFKCLSPHGSVYPISPPPSRTF